MTRNALGRGSEGFRLFWHDGEQVNTVLLAAFSQVLGIPLTRDPVIWKSVEVWRGDLSFGGPGVTLVQKVLLVVC